MERTRKKRLACIGVSGVLILGGCFGRDRKTYSIYPNAPKSPALPRQTAVPIDPELRVLAKAQIIKAFNSQDELARSHAVEAAQDVLGADSHAIVEAGLKDRAAQVRFASLMAAGTLQLKDLHDQALAMKDDPSEKVRLAARFALHRMGDTHLSHDFEKQAQAPDPRVREDAALLLGLTGDRSALNVLRDLARDPSVEVRIAVAEARWRLGDEQGLETLAGFMSGQELVYRLQAMMGITAPKNIRVAGNLQAELTDVSIEAQLVAARCLGDLGLDDGYGVAVKQIGDKAPGVRGLAALALGSIGRSDAQPLLRPMLDDLDEDVRLSAATAILELRPPPDGLPAPRDAGRRF